MVLLARRALQERLTSKNREGTGGEGIEEGSIVTVMGGRHFPSFSAGDTGEVVKVDREALNCDVLFEGASQAVPVALRHLKLGKNDASLNASATMAAALRVGSPVLRGTGGLTKSQREDDDWEEIAAVMEAKALADARVEAANARAAEAERRALALERQVEANGALAKAAMAVAAEGNNTAPSPRSHASMLETTYGAVNGSTEAVRSTGMAPSQVSPSDLASSDSMLLSSAVLEPPMGTTRSFDEALARAEAATSRRKTFTFDNVIEASSKEDAEEKVLSKEQDVRVEALESRLAALEERHRAEVASLRTALEDALAYGKQQEARAASLEQRLRSGPQFQATTATDTSSSSTSLPTSASDAVGRGHSVTVASGRMAPGTLNASTEGHRTPLTPTASVPIAPGSWPSQPLSARRVPRTANHHLCAAPTSLWSQGQPRQAVSLPEAPRRLSSSPSCSTPTGQRPSTPTRTSSIHSTLTESASVSVSSEVPLISVEGAAGVRRSLSASVPPGRQSSSGTASPRQAFLVANLNGQALTAASMTRLRPSSQGPPGSSAMSGALGSLAPVELLSCSASTPGRHCSGASHSSTPAMWSSPAGIALH